jgi:hypothetical protein
MMEAVSNCEMSVNIYQITRRNIPEGSHLHTRRCENLKSHLDGISKDAIVAYTKVLTYPY